MYRSTSGQSQSDDDAYDLDGVGQWASGGPPLTGNLVTQHGAQRPPPGYTTSMRYPDSTASSYPAAPSGHHQARSSSFSSNNAYADPHGTYAYQAPYPSRSNAIQAHSSSSSAMYATDGHANVPAPSQAYLQQQSFQDGSARPPVPAYVQSMHPSSQQYSRLPSSPPAARYGQHPHMPQHQSPSPPLSTTARYGHPHARPSTLDQRSPSSSPQDTQLRLQGQEPDYGLRTNSTSATHSRPGHSQSSSSSSIGNQYNVHARLGRPQPELSTYTDNREQDSRRLYTMQPMPSSSSTIPGWHSVNQAWHISSSSSAASSSSTAVASSSRRGEGRPTERPKDFVCSFKNCGSVFTSDNARKRHEHDRHSGKVHRCQHCGETFADSTSVPRHEKVCKKRPGAGAGPYSDS